MKWFKRGGRTPIASWKLCVGLVVMVAVANFLGCGDEPQTSTSASSSSSSGESSSSSSGSSSSGSSSSGSSSGGYACTGDGDCTEFTQCNGDLCLCWVVGCKNGFCREIEPLSEGSLSKSQTKNDCQKNVCDGNGFITAVYDPTDGTPDGNDCTDDLCSAGQAIHPPSAEGTPCAQGLCDGNGVCIQCHDTTQCANGTICVASKCIPPTCTNGTKDGSETDVDCGGMCNGCAASQQCLANTDCKSGVCMGNVCQ